MSSLIGHFYRFGDFAIDADQRVLLRGGKPVALTPKVFDTLLILVEQRGRIVGKDELMGLLWPDSFVEESNLTFNIKQLRKALNDHAHQPAYIETVARRGYRFIAEVEEVLSEASLSPGRISVRPSSLEPKIGNGFAGSGFVSGDESLPVAEAVPEIAAHPPHHPAEPAVTRHSTARPYIVWSSVSVVLIISLAAIVFWWLSASNVAPARQRKVERLTANGKTELAAVSPDGKFVAYLIDNEGQQSLWLKNVVAASDVQILPPTENVALGSVTFSPDGNYIYYGAKGVPDQPRGVLYQLPILGGTPKKVLQDYGGIVQHNEITFSPDGKHFAFIRYSLEGEEIAAMIVANADGTNERILASSKRPTIFYRSAAWSPDGKVIACAAMASAGATEIVTVRVADGVVSSIPSPLWRGIRQLAWRPDSSGLLVIGSEGDNFLSQIWQLSYPSGGARNITDDSNNYQSISHTADGRSVVTVRAEQEAHLWVMPGAETSQAKQLTSGFDKYDGIYAINWLHNGKIVYEANPSGKSEVWMIDADGRNAKRLATDTLSTSASLDGSYLVFRSRDDGVAGLFKLSLGDGEKKRLTTGTDYETTFSPDGKWVVFTRYADQVALWKVSIEGGAAVKLTNFPGYLLAPTISPDGKLIAFRWGASGSRKVPEIALVLFDGGEIVKTFNASIGYPPGYGKLALQWTPDGQALSYIAYRDGVSNIFRQPIDGGPPVQVTNFRDGRIFNFAYSPDGKQLALSRGTFNRDVILITDPY